MVKLEGSISVASDCSACGHALEVTADYDARREALLCSVAPCKKCIELRVGEAVGTWPKHA